MKKLLTITLFLLTALPLAAQRGKKKTAPKAPEVDIHALMQEYRFSEAIDALDDQIEYLESKKLSTAEAEALQEQAYLMNTKLMSTERVTFVDSLVVDKDSLFSHLALSSECGQVGTEDNAVFFLSQLGNQKIVSLPNAAGVLQLYTSELIGGLWGDPEYIAGLQDDGANACYPFMMSDGSTLYYAAQGEESFGGYDIFMTRYDADTHSFLSPTNIGMPFNSAANDYLYCIDEFMHLGWFVTDRNQPDGKVCIYIFIPNETRQPYNVEAISESDLRSFARLESIRSTWSNQDAVRQALQRLEDARIELQEEVDNAEFEFVINDRKTYTHLSDFRNSQAQQQMQWYVEGLNDTMAVAQQLKKLRSQYAATPSTDLKTQIQTLEEQYRKQLQTLQKQAKEIRRLEQQ